MAISCKSARSGTTQSWSLASRFRQRFVGSGIVQIDGGGAGPLLRVCTSVLRVFGTDRVRSLRDLKGRRWVPSCKTAVHDLSPARPRLVGLRPSPDIEWVTQPTAE